MKKLFLTLFTLLLVNVSAIAQLNQRPNGDHYLTPDSYGNPINLDAFVFDSTWGHYYWYDQSMIGGTSAMNPHTHVICDIAQPCYSDTLLTIVGISALFGIIDYEDMNGYLHIADTDFNIYRTVKIPQTVYDTGSSIDYIRKNYTEIFLEQPINVKGRFLVVWDNPKPNVSNVQYNYDYNYNYNYSNNIYYHAGLNANKDIKDADVIYKYLPYQRECYNDTLFAWEKQCEIMVSIFGTQYYKYSPQIYYLFPIFGELDSTLECVGCEIDSNDAGLTNNILIDMYSNIFPNPAKEELNIQCSFKIDEIEVYNTLGQCVLTKKVDKYYTLVNTSFLEKGSYILRIKTKSGYTNKKFIVK